MLEKTVLNGTLICRWPGADREKLPALRFAPIRMTNAQNASCHAVDENVTLAALAEGVRCYKRLLKDYEL